MRSTTVLGLLLAVSLTACGDMGWRKNGGGTVSQFNDDSYACKLTAARAANAGGPAPAAPAPDASGSCTSRGEGLTACKPATSAGPNPAPSVSAADGNAAILERGWRECMLGQGWREVEGATKLP